MAINQEPIYGSTGEIGKDGVLTPDQVMKLDAIQDSAVSALQAYLDDDEKPLVAMATGIGKGKIIHDLLEDELRKKPDAKMLVIAGTKIELVRQTHDAMVGYQEKNLNPSGGMIFEGLSIDEDDYRESEELDELNEDGENPLADQQSFLIRSGRMNETSANVHITTIQGLLAKLKRNPEYKPEDEYDLVVVDEVHNIGTPKRFDAIKRFKRVAGLTATPRRSSGRMKEPGEYGFRVVEQLPLPEAQELRLLPPLLGMQINTAEIIDEIPTTKRGKIDFRKLETMLKKSPDLQPYIANKVAQIIAPPDGRRYKTVIAVNFVWEAQKIAELLKEKGIKVGIAVNEQASKTLHSEEIPAMDSIKRYKLPESNEDSLQVLISPYVASEGFDAPFTEVLVWASPTDSSLRYTQYVGRLARRANGKLFGVVVDCLYQTSQYNWSYNFGMWMKGHVRQLDNGLLWLGPEDDINRLRNLPQMQTFIAQSDYENLDSLQRTAGVSILDPETEFGITPDSLTIFSGGYTSKLSPIVDEVLSILREENHDDVFVRKSLNRGKHFRAISRNVYPLFIKLVQEKGVALVVPRIDPITEFGLTKENLTSIFIGEHEKISLAAEEVLQELEDETSGITFKRASENGRGAYFSAISRNNYIKFTELMKQKGIRLKGDVQELNSELEYAMTQKNLTSMFRGSYSKLIDIVDHVLQELETEYKVINFSRNSSGRAIRVLPKNILPRFIELMQVRGAKLK